MSTTHHDYPDPATFKTGDIVWPRHPDVRTLPTFSLAMDLVEALKDMIIDVARFLESLKMEARALDRAIHGDGAPSGRPWPDNLADLAKGAPGAEEPSAAPPEWSFLSFSALADFILLYQAQLWSLGAQKVAQRQETPLEMELKLPDWLRTRLDEATFLGVYVGHVGLIEVVDGKAWIVESTYRLNGVRTVPYDVWERQRRDINALIWHGRFLLDGQEINSNDGARVLEAANLQRMLGKQYAIFDTKNLDDTNYVYCSELVYLAARAIGINLDTRSFPSVFPYLGPRALSRHENVRMLNEPRNERY